MMGRTGGRGLPSSGSISSRSVSKNIEFSDASRELVQKYSANKMDLKAYEVVSQHASNVAAQQKVRMVLRGMGSVMRAR